MIATVYKPSRWKDGRRVIGRMYRGKYRLDPLEKIKDVPLHTNDKQVAQQKLRKILQAEQRERDGIFSSKEQRETASVPLQMHVEDFIADRRALRRDEKYVRELRKRLFRLIEECGWQFVRDVTAGSFCAWRTRQQRAAKTLNEYLNAVCGLMNWLEPRVGRNPLRFVQKVEANGVGGRVRRAFTEDELQRLIGVSGLRGVVYLVAARTGIRRGELVQIEWRDVHLDTTQPFVFVRASISKNHRQAMQPLTFDAVEALREFRSNDAKPYDRVFAGLISRDLEQFKKDLEAAAIPYVDARGEYADLHSLRKTFGTMLTLAGVGQRTVMELMRHSDMRLTAKTYTDANMLPISDAMSLLTRFAAARKDSQRDSQKLVPDSPSVSATVPLKAGEPKVLTVGKQTFSPLEAASVQESPQAEEIAPCRNRTCNPVIKSHLLCQLS